MIYLTPQNRQYLKARAHSLKPVLIIGKDGITEAFKSELIQIIGKKELIKCKLSKVAQAKNIDFETVINAISRDINIIAKIGHTYILFKPKADHETCFALKESRT